MSTDPTNLIPPPPDVPGVPPAPQPYPGYPPYQQQYPPQGAWPQQQYMQAPRMPKPPSAISDPKLFVDKLPLVAMIVFIGFAVVGLFNAILMFATTGTISSALNSISPYGGVSGLGGIMAGLVFSGLATLIQYLVYGLIAFSALMVVKHFLDLKQAKIDAAAQADS